MADYTTATDCRICKTHTGIVADFGPLALTSSFPHDRDEVVPKIPLEVRHCTNCGLLQLGHDTNRDLMYRKGYGYKSGVNESMVQHLKELVEYAAQFVNPGDRICDIGCNDGTLLKFWGPKLVLRVGFDPIGEWVRGADVFPEYFHPLPQVTYKCITSIAMFYDVPDPIGFAKDVAVSLAPDGVWILELGYAGGIQEGKWDVICHEHLTYYGLRQLDYIARMACLRITDVSFNDANGGSIRVTMHHRDPQRFEPFWDKMTIGKAEEAWGWASYLDSEVAIRCHSILKALSQFEKVYVLGASTKGNSLLQIAGIDHTMIPCAIERFPEKVGRFTPGSNIPIRDEQYARDNPPDAFLVLPYHFKESILARYADLREKGVKFIFPLPSVEIV
jgi:NDP-4-keto-2,6-dideoxyhexose 3-C-methyltransferase